MRKVVGESLESLAAYRIVEVERPACAPGQVLIQVAACGLGYVDSLLALGRYQVKPPVPFTPGQEVAGVIAEVGEGVTGLSVGDRVMATLMGGLSEVVAAPAAVVSKTPDRLGFAEAAALRLNYLTALHALTDRGAVQAGEWVVVMGAAGGLGAAGVQLAKLLGAKVVAVASSPEKRAFCEALGADAVLDTEPEGWRERLKAACGGVAPDVVFDPVCGPLFEPAFRSLNWRGRHLVLGFVGGPIPALKSNLTLMKGAALIGVDVRQFQIFEPKRTVEHVTRLLDWTATGELVPPVGSRYPFEAFGEAMDFALTGKSLGKIVVEITGRSD
ncbi:MULTISPECIES: NADPH:quinone oxidoreductase family protein [Phenylobacterium]|jgi:NADPH2:quinone reductase|uniref:NADPH:quinone oxidoreductase family protein n=1 Tax=Phenylobacterium conjunctum TaxID=1298959 RepID=A0ABW3SW35_9CAUL